jgi:hypothetical protein
MNTRLFSFLAILTLAQHSCTKEDPNDKFYWGEATATKNQLPAWEARPRCVVNKPYNQGIDIIINVFNDKGFKREDLFFYKIPNEVGTYQITSSSLYAVDSTHGASYRTLLDDGDVLGDRYSLHYGKIENKLIIDKKMRDEIWGTFQVAFVKDKTFLPEDPTAPDTVVFTNGKFHTKLLTE